MAHSACRARTAGGGGGGGGRALPGACACVCALALALACCLPGAWGAAAGGRDGSARGPARRDGGACAARLRGGGGRCPGDRDDRTAGHAAAALARSTLRLRGGSTWGSTWGSSSFSGSKKAHNPENDPEVDLEHCPNDGITDLRFSPKALLPNNYLVATTWDGEVRCYQADPASGKTTPVGMQRHEKPAMCCAWKSDGSAIYSGSADGKCMMWHLASNSWTQVAQHDGPITGVFYSDTPSPCVITGSWDRTVKFWDASSAPTVSVPARARIAGAGAACAREKQGDGSAARTHAR